MNKRAISDATSLQDYLEFTVGIIKRIVNGNVLTKPVLDLNVANSVERCLCGIAVSNYDSTPYVFLYYTEIEGPDGGDKMENLQWIY